MLSLSIFLSELVRSSFNLRPSNHQPLIRQFTTIWKLTGFLTGVRGLSIPQGTQITLCQIFRLSKALRSKYTENRGTSNLVNAKFNFQCHSYHFIFALLGDSYTPMMDLLQSCWLSFFLLVSTLVVDSYASPGDADLAYRSCINQCKDTGCVGVICFPQCQDSLSNVSAGAQWYTHESLSLQLRQLNCLSNCKYHCMINREKEREAQGYTPVKYHGKWPFKQILGMQEPVSVFFSALNLAMHFQGWSSFLSLLYNKLPLMPNKKPFYEYGALWHIYGLLSMNSWLWSAVFHSRDVDVTEKLDYTSAVAVLGFSLILAILRSFNVRHEAARVMVAAPLAAFVTTHILYLNFYKLDYGWNMQVCVVMAVTQLLMWAIWAGITRHPSRWKLWLVVFGGGLAMLLEIFDFPPYAGYVDAHSLWHATTVPLTYVWWSFIQDDAKCRTLELKRKLK